MNANKETAAKYEARKGNYQDAFADKESGKRGGKKGGRRGGKRGGNGHSGDGKDTSQTGTFPIMGRGYTNHPYWHYTQYVKPESFATFTDAYDMAMPVTQWPEGVLLHNDGQISIPGIMRLDVVPVFGETGYLNAALNQAGQQMFQFLQSVNNRAPQYSYTDIIMVEAALGGAFSCYKWLTRAYGYTTDYDQDNRYKPKTLVNAMNINFDLLIKDKANFRDQLNLAAEALDSLYFPQSVDYVERAIYLYETVYCDASQSAHSQLYFFQPTGFWKLIEGDTTQPLTHLEFVDLCGGGSRHTLLTPETALSILWDLINAIMNSQDAMNIAADLRKALGDNGRYKVNPIDEMFKLTPTYDDYFLYQMENAYVGDCIISQSPSGKGLGPNKDQTIYGTLSVNPAINAGFFTCDIGYLPSNLPGYVSGGGSYNAMHHYNEAWVSQTNYMINFHKESPTAQDVIEATRLSGIFVNDITVPTGTNPYQSRITGILATEIIAGAYLYRTIPGSTIDRGASITQFTSYFVDPIQYQYYGTNGSSSASSPQNATLLQNIHSLAQIEAFDWHPRCFHFSSPSGNTYFKVVDEQLIVNPDFEALGRLSVDWASYDYDNYVIVGADNLRNMARHDMLGQWIPKTLPNVSGRNPA